MTDNSPKAIVLRMLDQAMLDRRDGLNETLNVVAEADLVVIEGRWTSTLARDENTPGPADCRSHRPTRSHRPGEAVLRHSGRGGTRRPNRRRNPMTDNSPRAVYLRMLDAYNDGTPDSYGSDKFLDHFADDADRVRRWWGGREAGGQQVFRDALPGANEAFRNRHSVPLEVVAEGDRVIARIHFTATAAIDTPDWKAGTTIHNDYVDFATVRGGKIVDYSAVIGPLLPDGGMK
ncbi:nuclear transport factor 2 family protein [Candidatus Amarobacter glycogenicus]|uniref:nuclear transport factor 2 family protein n=1 Tax=Candidatus Amarobacter glycogenicus TaxID=3140699 RepID=UPI00313683DE|nr:nuclear transport factor 2 family protein [Dehalococcoidia bacterium]